MTSKHKPSRPTLKTKPGRTPKKHRPRPAWDDSIHDQSEYQLTEEEVQKRKQLRGTSKFNLLAKVQGADRERLTSAEMKELHYQMILDKLRGREDEEELLFRANGLLAASQQTHDQLDCDLDMNVVKGTGHITSKSGDCISLETTNKRKSSSAPSFSPLLGALNDSTRIEQVESIQKDEAKELKKKSATHFTLPVDNDKLSALTKAYEEMSLLKRKDTCCSTPNSCCSSQVKAELKEEKSKRIALEKEVQELKTVIDSLSEEILQVQSQQLTVLQFLGDLQDVASTCDTL